MRSDDDTIESIIKQLNDLQLEQNDLLIRLERARAEEVQQARTPTRPDKPQQARPFQVGDRVQIKNPGPFQATTGTITKVGNSRITVTTQSGSKILRAAKNLTLVR